MVERAGRAGLHALAAGDAGGSAHRIVEVEVVAEAIPVALDGALEGAARRVDRAVDVVGPGLVEVKMMTKGMCAERARHGIGVPEIPRAGTFCDRAVRQRETLIVAAR